MLGQPISTSFPPSAERKSEQVTMANYKCFGCKRPFQDKRALSAHMGKRQCIIKPSAEGARLLSLRSQNKAHQSDRSESIYDDGEGGASGYQPTAEEEMVVDQVGFFSMF